MKRHFLTMVLAAAIVPGPAARAQDTAATVYKTSGCGCCLGWMAHLEQNGFAPRGEDMFMGLLMRLKIDRGVPAQMVSCHTALIDGYVIEGHVPARDIRRLLNERPDAVGLAVPGMPYGAPGMGPEDERDAYDVYLIGRDGRVEVFSSYEEM